MTEDSRVLMNEFKRRTKDQKGVNEKLDMDDDLVDPRALEIEVEECTFDQDDPDMDVREDYEFIRRKLRWSIAACEKVFSHALRDLVSDPSPRVVEGCSMILKTVTESTNQLFQLHGNYRKIPKSALPDTPDDDGAEGEGKGKRLTATVNDIIEAFEKCKESADQDGSDME